MLATIGVMGAISLARRAGHRIRVLSVAEGNGT
jgi:hypothetical protein